MERSNIKADKLEALKRMRLNGCNDQRQKTAKELNVLNLTIHRKKPPHHQFGDESSEEESEDNAESEQNTQSFDEDSDIIERSEDDEAQSNTQIELEQELADQLRQNQVRFEDNNTMNLWNSTANRIKREDDTESEEEESTSYRKKRPSYKKGVNSAEIEEVKLEVIKVHNLMNDYQRGNVETLKKWMLK